LRSAAKGAESVSKHKAKDCRFKIIPRKKNLQTLYRFEGFVKPTCAVINKSLIHQSYQHKQDLDR
jgi:hypothetical protein